MPSLNSDRIKHKQKTKIVPSFSFLSEKQTVAEFYSHNQPTSPNIYQVSIYLKISRGCFPKFVISFANFEKHPLSLSFLPCMDPISKRDCNGATKYISDLYLNKQVFQKFPCIVLELYFFGKKEPFFHNLTMEIS